MTNYRSSEIYFFVKFFKFVQVKCVCVCVCVCVLFVAQAALGPANSGVRDSSLDRDNNETCAFWRPLALGCPPPPLDKTRVTKNLELERLLKIFNKYERNNSPVSGSGVRGAGPTVTTEI
jgi:hypothetical protein